WTAAALRAAIVRFRARRVGPGSTAGRSGRRRSAHTSKAKAAATTTPPIVREVRRALAGGRGPLGSAAVRLRLRSARRVRVEPGLAAARKVDDTIRDQRP